MHTKIKYLYIIVVILVIIFGYSYYNTIKPIEEIREGAEEGIAEERMEEKEEPPKKTEIEIEEVVIEPKEKEEVIIRIESGFFEPKEISIPVGTTVVWVNNDRRPHKIADEKRIFYGDRILPGETYAFTFTEAGVYDYSDVVFHTVKGRIIVESEAEFYPITGSAILKQSNPRLVGISILLLLGVIITFILSRDKKS